VGVDRLVTPFCQICLVASALDPPSPLRTSGVIALFQIGQRLDGELDRQRRNGGDNAPRDGVIKRFEGHDHAGA
jgi:hypothetical protein